MQADQELLNKIKSRIHTSLNWRHDSLPAPVAVPMKRYHLESLSLYNSYVVTVKKEGYRALVYHGPEGLYWYSTDGVIRTLHLEGLPDVTGDQITIFDADWIPADKTFYVSDSPIVRGCVNIYLNLYQRLNEFNMNWLEEKRGSVRDQFSIAIKPHYDASQTEIFKDDLQHGLIFIDREGKYTCGRCAHMWHWNVPEKNEILMRVRAITFKNPPRIGLWLYDEKERRETLHRELPANTSFTEGCIVECVYQRPKEAATNWFTGKWVPKRVRTDQSRPSKTHQLWSIVGSMESNLTLDVVVRAFIEHREQQNEQMIEE